TENGARIRIADGIVLHEASLVTVGADRGARLRGLAAAVGVPEAFVSELVTRGLQEDQERSAVIAEAARRNPPLDTRVPVMVTRDGRDSLVAPHGRWAADRILPGHRPQAGRE